MNAKELLPKLIEDEQPFLLIKGYHSLQQSVLELIFAKLKGVTKLDLSLTSAYYELVTWQTRNKERDSLKVTASEYRAMIRDYGLILLHQEDDKSGEIWGKNEMFRKVLSRYRKAGGEQMESEIKTLKSCYSTRPSEELGAKLREAKEKYAKWYAKFCKKNNLKVY
jgi:hypothetical protein